MTLPYTPQEAEAYIRSAAARRGMDPEIAVRVARSEGLRDYVGDHGSSFGIYQLHYGNVAPGGNKVGGLGDVFTRQTGLDARDPSTWRQQVDFSLDQAKKGSWSPWHGWKGPADAGLHGKFAGSVPAGPPAPTGLSMSGPSDLAALSFAETPPDASSGRSDPIGEILSQASGTQKKPSANLTALVQSLLAEPETQKQADSTDDAFLRQMMDFHNAQHTRAIKGLL